jgi:hypothetical protein
MTMRKISRILSLALAAAALPLVAALADALPEPPQSRLTEQAAARIVERLPAVVTYAQRVTAAGRRLVLRTEQQPAAGCDPRSRECRWCFYVGESDAERSVRWQTICVRPDNRAVTVIDPVSDAEIAYDAFVRSQGAAPPTQPAPPGKPGAGK